MKRVNIAKEKFSSSCNCAQSVLVALAGDVLDEDKLQLIASSFGGGIAQTGNACGAVTGALMALGLNRGYTQANTTDDKDAYYKIAKCFMHKFQEKFGALNCIDLIEFDISKPEEKGKAREADVFNNLCPTFVVAAVEIMSELLQDD